MIPSAPSSAENLSPVPVRERGRVPINKTILESQRKSPFCSRPLCFPTLYFYKHGGPRPTAFTQRSQLHIVAAVHAVLVLAAPPTLAPEQATPSSSPISAGNELSTGEGRGRLSNKNHPDPHARPARPGEEKTHNKGIVRSRPGGLGPQTLGYCVLGPGLSPRKAQPLDNGGGGAGVLLKQGGQMKGSQTDAQTQASSRKARRREKQVSRRGGGEGRGQLFPGPRR